MRAKHNNVKLVVEVNVQGSELHAPRLVGRYRFFQRLR